MQKEYWMVLGAGRPNYQHGNEQSAIDEAERLALLHPGFAFTVLKAVCTIRSNLQVSTVKYGRPQPLPTWLEQPKPSITIHTTYDKFPLGGAAIDGLLCPSSNEPPF